MAYSNAIFYIDFESGVDTARTALTTVIASNPSGSITRMTKAGHELTTGAVVDTASFTSWLNGAWKITVVDANNFDLDGAVWQATADASGTVTPRGGSSKTDAWKTISSAGASSARIQPGDTFRLKASPAPTSLGQNATWTNGSDIVTLTSAVTATIDDCESAWTPATNVTYTAGTTTYREGTRSVALNTATAFTTGLIAYRNLGATLDLSAYEQVSLLIRETVGKALGVFQIKLCSDTAGAVPVNTFDIPTVSSSQWTPIVLNNGAPLGSAIQSIALYALADPASLSIYIDNIIACKAASSADSLTHLSLIGKNNGDPGEPWFALRSISGTTIQLGLVDASSASPTGGAANYYGTSETVTAHKREPVVLTSTHAVQEAGSLGAPSLYSGGWDRADMSTQNDVTWVRHSLSITILTLSSYTTLEKLYWVADSGNGIANGTGANGVCVRDYAFCGSGASIGSGNQTRLENGRYGVGSSAGLALGSAAGEVYARLAKFWGAGPAIASSFALSSTGQSRKIVADVDEIRNVQKGYLGMGSADLVLRNTVFAGVTTEIAAGNAARITLQGCTLPNGVDGMAGSGAVIYSHNEGGVAGAHKQYHIPAGAATFSIISAATDQRHTASGLAWKIAVTSTTISEAFPLTLPLAKLLCEAGITKTVTLWVRRNNLGLALRLRAVGGDLGGVASDVTAQAVGSADTWEQLSISFTPSETGVLEIVADAWGGTTYLGWVDDLGVS